MTGETYLAQAFAGLPRWDATPSGYLGQTPLGLYDQSAQPLPDAQSHVMALHQALGAALANRATPQGEPPPDGSAEIQLAAIGDYPPAPPGYDPKT